MHDDSSLQYSYVVGGNWEDQGLRPAWAKSYKTPSQPMAGHGDQPVIPAMWGSSNRRTVIQAGPRMK
jgi:hypothetical protein